MSKLKLLTLGVLLMASSYGEIRIRPSIVQGKMTNGSYYRELIPFRVSYTPSNEWNFGLGYSMGFEDKRSEGFFQTYDHRGWKFIGKVQYKPLKFLEQFFPDTSLTDFAISYTKQIGDYYAGSSLAVSRLSYEDYEEVSVGFDFTI